MNSAPVQREGEKCECSNSRGISLLTAVGKQYGRVPIKRIRGRTKCAIGEEQCGFRQGRGCMDQFFAVRQVCEKSLANGKDVYWALMDLEANSVWCMWLTVLTVYVLTVYVADANSVWSFRKNFESSAKFL